VNCQWLKRFYIIWSSISARCSWREKTHILRQNFTNFFAVVFDLFVTPTPDCIAAICLQTKWSLNIKRHTSTPEEAVASIPYMAESSNSCQRHWPSYCRSPLKYERTHIVGNHILFVFYVLFLSILCFCLSVIVILFLPFFFCLILLLHFFFFFYFSGFFSVVNLFPHSIGLLVYFFFLVLTLPLRVLFRLQLNLI